MYQGLSVLSVITISYQYDIYTNIYRLYTLAVESWTTANTNQHKNNTRLLKYEKIRTDNDNYVLHGVEDYVIDRKVYRGGEGGGIDDGMFYVARDGSYIMRDRAQFGAFVVRILISLTREKTIDKADTDYCHYSTVTELYL